MPATSDGSASWTSSASRCRTRSATSASATTRLAAASSRTARIVRSPSSPGPAPTNATQPSISVMRIIPVGVVCAHQVCRAERQHPRRQLTPKAGRFACVRFATFTYHYCAVSRARVQSARLRSCRPGAEDHGVQPQPAAVPGGARSRYAPTGALQPASRAASSDRSAVTAARVGRVVDGREQPDRARRRRPGIQPRARPGPVPGPCRRVRRSRSPGRSGRSWPAPRRRGPPRRAHRRAPSPAGCSRSRGWARR